MPGSRAIQAPRTAYAAYPYELAHGPPCRVRAIQAPRTLYTAYQAAL
eukprot:CAMPEP_0206276884 /NCGR_PEP_ID=MMETSP0047_2-20121206/36543_1 /ASSEMBLY_ACC=CAM_ASM_000192 /TAXON_ID=195065 /ORGANISM="Chroomonas mesostigmatica_cf, Strain CCMP1168" /LENGTH=46 /DNA_ID= /DNA_START= /DNA_END= /DNA_ORIENTATION=